MPRTFVVGDIHGAHRALRQCLEQAAFDYNHDHLISLGDVADGWPETRACVEELLRIKNLTHVLGNHDWHTREWMESGVASEIWLGQGGRATMASYAQGVPREHLNFFKRARPYFVLDGKVFVHAGIDPRTDMRQQELTTLLWDRNLARRAIDVHLRNTGTKLTPYDEIFVGHTPSPFGKPVRAGGVWLMDTGAGWGGVLSLMDIDDYTCYLSDPVPALYPGVAGRRALR